MSTLDSANQKRQPCKHAGCAAAAGSHCRLRLTQQAQQRMAPALLRGVVWTILAFSTLLSCILTHNGGQQFQRSAVPARRGRLTLPRCKVGGWAAGSMAD